jgi:hypothetical protein
MSHQKCFSAVGRRHLDINVGLAGDEAVDVALQVLQWRRSTCGQFYVNILAKNWHKMANIGGNGKPWQEGKHKIVVGRKWQKYT